MQPVSRKFLITFLLFALLGFADAGYLTAKHYLGGTLPCFTVGSCESVTTSSYSKILGIPVPVLGTLYYFSILLLTFLYWDQKNPKILKLAARLTLIGLLASIYFVSLQLFVIHAICQYCMLSAISSTALFILGIVIQRRLKQTQSA